MSTCLDHGDAQISSVIPNVSVRMFLDEFLILLVYLIFFLWLNPWHMEFHILGMEFEPQL